ncbi:MAG: hypothetical protein LBG27_01090 [Spirochaetaceae bacterium]|jgi:hypothetical protein|nr:hypothetical protein [Spirochaetaceae bacterium]
MRGEAAFWGGRESFFKSAKTMLRERVPAEITGPLIEEAACYAGKRAHEEDSRRAEPAERNMDKMPDKPEESGILNLTADGSAANIWQKNEKGPARKENKLG